MLVKLCGGAGQGFPAIRHPHLGDAREVEPVALADDRAGAALNGRVDVIVAVRADAGYRNKGHARHHAAGVVGQSRHFTLERSIHPQRGQRTD